jgi:queuine tRNA-ribosyltransferase
MLKINILKEDRDSFARLTSFDLNGHEVQTPLFMPVGTKASVKALDSYDLDELSFPVVLANTYHLYLRPGPDIIAGLGGLHRFAGMSSAMLTDSGGFQVFSLKELRKIDDEGVDFRSIIDGSSHRFTPERVIKIQRQLGADIIMAFDECAPHDASEAYLRKSLQRTHRWADESLAEYENSPLHQHLFGIIQGGLSESMRRESQDYIQSRNFSGIAVGGLSVGESKEEMKRILEVLAPGYDRSRLRYLMGVGTPLDFINAVSCGIDMFDCVMPTRVARHARVYTESGELNLMNARFATLDEPLDKNCSCRVCKRYSCAYLHHLFKAKEMTAMSLASFHNLHFFKKFMEQMREAISADRFSEFRRRWSPVVP